MTTNDPVFWTAIGGAFAALSSAIAVQWKTTMSHLARVETKLDECESDRFDLWRVLAKQAGKDIDEIKKG
jgi:hypothetical protein